MNKILDKINDMLMSAHGPLGQNGMCIVYLDYVTYPYDLGFVRALDAYAGAAGAVTIHTPSRGWIRKRRSVQISGTVRRVRRTLDFLESMMETRVLASSEVYVSE